MCTNIKNIIKYTLILFILTNFNLSFAQEFNHFTLTPTFKNLLDTNFQTLNNNSNNSEFIQLLIPQELESTQNYNLSIATTSNGNISLDNILKILHPFLTSQGLANTNNSFKELLSWKKDFGGKISNFGTMQWHQPLGYISINSRRDFEEIASNKVQVDDILEINVHADTFLKHLSEKNLINITNEQLGAFANLSFHKIFRYKHYKSSLEEAQKADLETLLFPYQFLNFPYLLKLSVEDEISSKDYLSLDFGASASATFWGFLKAEANVKSSLEYQHGSTIKMVVANSGELNYQYKRTNGTKFTLDVDASIAADLLKLIDLTLFKLSYSYQYEFQKTSYYQSPIFIWGDYKSGTLIPSRNFWVGEEKSTRKESDFNSKFLMWGSSSGTSIQKGLIKSKQTEVSFKEEMRSKESYTHSLFGGIVSNLLGDLLSSFLGFSKKFSENQIYALSESNDPNNFQLEASRSIYLDSRNNFWTFGKDKMVGNYILNHNLIPTSVKELWTNKWFKKNILINDRYSFSRNVFSHLSYLGSFDMQKSSVYLCNLENHPGVNLYSAEQPLNWALFSWKEKSCIKSSFDKLKKFVEETNYDNKSKRLYNFLSYFFKHSSNSMALYSLFPSNIMSHHTQIFGSNKQGRKFKGSYNRSSNEIFDLQKLLLYDLNIWR